MPNGANSGRRCSSSRPTCMRERRTNPRNNTADKGEGRRRRKRAPILLLGRGQSVCLRDCVKCRRYMCTTTAKARQNSARCTKIQETESLRMFGEEGIKINTAPKRKAAVANSSPPNRLYGLLSEVRPWPRAKKNTRHKRRSAICRAAVYTAPNAISLRPCRTQKDCQAKVKHLSTAIGLGWKKRELQNNRRILLEHRHFRNG